MEVEAERDRFKGTLCLLMKGFPITIVLDNKFCFYLIDSSAKNQAAKDAALQEIGLLKSEVKTLKRTRQAAVEKSIAIWKEEENKRVEAAKSSDAGLVIRLRALT